MTEKREEGKGKATEKKESLAKSEEDWHEQERTARVELKAADELLKESITKLDEALSFPSINKSSVSVAKMMLNTAAAKVKRLWLS